MNSTMKRTSILAVAMAAAFLLGQGAPALAAKPPVVNGTTQLGACDSLEALTAAPTPSFVCLGSASTDFRRLRTAYRKGGAKAAQAESSREASTLLASASSAQQLVGYLNHKNTTTSWTFYATVIYGTVRSDGTITEYGRFFTRDDILLYGGYAKFTFYADRTAGSALKFRLSNWFSIITGGGSWSDTPKVCQQSVYSGDKYSCNHSYYLAGSGGNYTGLSFYGKSRVTWWNQYSPNPSSSDGSWTLIESHGPMDCKSGRTQRCQWR